MRIIVSAEAMDSLIELMESNPPEFERMIVEHLSLITELENGNPN